MTHGMFNLPDDQARRDAHSDHDALADLFLEDIKPSMGESPRPRIRLVDDGVEARRACGVEVLVLGHLPVLGSAWIGPFASLRAEQAGGPMGLVRIHGEEVSVDVVCAGGSTRPDVTVTPGMERALAAAARVVRGWIARADASSEGSLLRAHNVDRVTLLTGADEPAIVAAYRLLKGISDTLGDRRDVRLGVAVVGSDAGRCAEVLRRLRESAAEFLKRDIEDASRLERIGVCPMTGVYLGDCSGGAARVMSIIGGAEAAGLAGPVEAEQTAPEVVVRTAGVRLPRPARAIPAMNPEGEPAIQDKPAPGPVGDGESLAARLPGLTLVGRLCPHAPDVEVAVDGAGGVHLVAGTLGDGTDNGNAVEGLLAAAGWAHAHGVLLRRISPGVRDGEPTLHLVTDSAPRVRPLLDSVLRVHLLAGGAGGEAMIELN